MSDSYPFPTLKKLAQIHGIPTSGFDTAAESTALAEKQLTEALSNAFPDRRFLDADSSLILCGSFARYEMTSDSDYDWSLLIDGVVNTQHSADSRTIATALEDAKLTAPGSSGTFGNLVFSHDLVHRIGGGADSNANLTRRMLLLLESRPYRPELLSQSYVVWENTMRNILKRYFEEEVHFSPEKRRVPRFLLNDLTRYWRTICVDYAAKHRDQEGQKWAMRNAKLRFSRKIIYASGLAFCLGCELAPPHGEPNLFGSSDSDGSGPFIEAALKFARTPSLEYLAAFVDAHVTDTEKQRKITELVFGSYNQWLEIVANEANRDCLERLTHEKAAAEDVFIRIQEISRDFAAGLQLLFFNRDSDPEPIANLSLSYVGF